MVLASEKHLTDRLIEWRHNISNIWQIQQSLDCIGTLTTKRFQLALTASGFGRFLSPDTIVPDPKDPQSFNRYTYSLNNPIKYTDSTGHYVDQGGVVGGGCDFLNVLPCLLRSAHAMWQLKL